MRSLVEMFNEGKDVIIKDIPVEWYHSYKKFLFGQTYYKNDDGDDVTYYSDYYRWYKDNKQAIDRDDFINKIID